MPSSIASRSSRLHSHFPLPRSAHVEETPIYDQQTLLQRLGEALDRLEQTSDADPVEVNRLYLRWTQLQTQQQSSISSQTRTPYREPQASYPAPFAQSHPPAPTILDSAPLFPPGLRILEMPYVARGSPYTAQPTLPAISGPTADLPRTPRHVGFYTGQPQLAESIATEAYRSLVVSGLMEDGEAELEAKYEAWSRYLVESVMTVLYSPGHYRDLPDSSPEMAFPRKSSPVDYFPPHRVECTAAREPSAGPKQYQYRPSRPTALPLHLRTVNPYGFPADFWATNSEQLHFWVYRLILHMRIPVHTIVAAVWFIQGLPFHEGDCEEGHVRRHFGGLTHRGMIRQAVVMGLLLAGKCLDDHCYHNRSWGEYGEISLRDVNRLDVIGFKHYRYSLDLSGAAWVQHCLEQRELLLRRQRDKYSQVLHTTLDELWISARESEAQLSRQVARARDISAPLIFANPDRAVGQADRSVDEEEISDVLLDEQHERFVSALVDDDDDDIMDDASDFSAEYDGALPFITREDIRRSLSNTSGDVDIGLWRSRTHDSQASANWEQGSNYAHSGSYVSLYELGPSISHSSQDVDRTDDVPRVSRLQPASPVPPSIPEDMLPRAPILRHAVLPGLAATLDPQVTADPYPGFYRL